MPLASISPIKPIYLSQQALRPTLIRSLFNTEPKELVKDEGIVAEFHRIGLTHITFQTFPWPSDPTTTFDQFCAYWKSTTGWALDWAKANGLRVVATADDALRTPGERQRYWTTPWSTDATEFVATNLTASGIVDCLEVIDEVDSDPAIYKPQSFIDRWRAANGPPMAWPNKLPIQWETPALSDYNSRYWTVWAPGDSQSQFAGIKAASFGLNHDRPWLCAASCVGPYYDKYKVGGDFSDGDYVHDLGVRGREVIGQLWTLLAYGASGFRLYGYDWAFWRDQRLTSQLGTDELQTGSRPGDSRWAGVANAILSVANREQQLLTVTYTPTVNGPWVGGRRGDLWWTVNKSLVPRDAGQIGTVVTAQGEIKSRIVPSGCVVIFD